MSDHTYTQRAGVFALLPHFLLSKGLDPKPIFGNFNVDIQNLEPSSNVPLAAMLSVVDVAARSAHCPELGLRLGSAFTMELHGVLGALMASAPDLREALNGFVRWQLGYSSANVVYMMKWDDLVALGFGTYARGTVGVEHLYSAAMAIGSRMVEQLTAGEVRPVEVHFSLGRPPFASMYEKLLGVPVLFEQDQTCIVLRDQDLDTVLPGANASVHARLQQQIENALKLDLMPVAKKVRHIVRPMVYRGAPTMPKAAKALRMHPRTLRRRLASEGITFDEIRDEVRHAMAQEFLALTTLDMASIAAALSFANASSFNRAFRRWADVPPSFWRERLAQGDEIAVQRDALRKTLGAAPDHLRKARENAVASE